MDEVLQDLFAYASLICGDRGDALRELLGVLRETGQSRDTTTLLIPLARKLDRGRADYTITILDNLLRADQTRPLGDREPQQIRALAWELKRRCLTATLGCLTPSIRQAFVLCAVMGYSRAEAAEILGISVSALGVRLSRANRRLDATLAVRCQHYDRAAPCTCVGRLGTALNVGFVDAPPPAHDVPAGAHDEDGPIADARLIYQKLPRARLSAEEVAGLIVVASIARPPEIEP